MLRSGNNSADSPLDWQVAAVVVHFCIGTVPLRCPILRKPAGPDRFGYVALLL
jgi:hypothetical protein